MGKSIGEMLDNPIDQEAIAILQNYERHANNAKQFFLAVAGERIEAGRVVAIDKSAPRIAGMPVVFELPYGPQNRAKRIESKKQARRAFGLPCVVHDSSYMGDNPERILFYVGDGKHTSYPIHDVRGYCGYGGHMELNYVGGKSTESSVLVHASPWPSVGTVGHCDFGPPRIPDVHDLCWRDSYPTYLAQFIKSLAQGTQA